MSQLIKSKRIGLRNVRVMFPAIFEKANYKGDEKYECTFIMDPVINKGDIKLLETEIEEILRVAKSNGRPDVLPADVICLREGNPNNPEAVGRMTIKGRSTIQPKVIDREKKTITAEDKLIYGGCYVNAIVELWYQDNQWGNRINCTLYGLQFITHGATIADKVIEEPVEVTESDFNMFDIQL